MPNTSNFRLTTLTSTNSTIVANLSITFYELINSYLLRLLKTTDLMEQDAICNELVSNLRAGDNCVSVIKLNPPYDLLADLPEILSGRGYRIRTDDLATPSGARYQLR